MRRAQTSLDTRNDRVANIVAQSVLVTAARERPREPVYDCDGADKVLMWAEWAAKQSVNTPAEVAALVAVTTLAIRVDDTRAERLLNTVTGIVDAHCHLGLNEARGMVISGSVSPLGVAVTDAAVKRVLAAWATELVNEQHMSVLAFRVVVSELAQARETKSLVRDPSVKIATQTIDFAAAAAATQKQTVESDTASADDSTSENNDSGSNGGRELTREDAESEKTVEETEQKPETTIETTQAVDQVQKQKAQEAVQKTVEEAESEQQSQKTEPEETAQDDKQLEKSYTDEDYMAVAAGLKDMLQSTFSLDAKGQRALELLPEEHRLDVMCFALTLRSEAFSGNPKQAETLLTRIYKNHFGHEHLSYADKKRLKTMAESLATYRLTVTDASQQLFGSPTTLECELADMWAEAKTQGEEPVQSTASESETDTESSQQDDEAFYNSL